MWLAQFFRIIKFNSGFYQSFLMLLRTDALKIGKFRGQDEMGNRYYENNYYFFGTNRWVIYSNHFGYDYEASCIHPAWFRWIHYMTDLTPIEENRCTYHWMLPYRINQTGTKDEYIPYSTTKPKIIPWEPPIKPCQLKK